MPNDQLSRVFSALADPTRREMVATLALADLEQEPAVKEELYTQVLTAFVVDSGFSHASQDQIVEFAVRASAGIQRIDRRDGGEPVVPDGFDDRTTLGQSVARDVREFFKEKVFNTIIPRNVRLGEAPSHGIPGVLYDAKSRGAAAYVALARELLARHAA